MKPRTVGIANTARKRKNLALVLSDEVDHALQDGGTTKTSIAVPAGKIIVPLAGRTRANREPTMAPS